MFLLNETKILLQIRMRMIAFSIHNSFKISLKLGFKLYRRFASTTTMKVFTQKRNPITGDTEWDVQHEDYDYHQEIARSAFADMLHDTERNKKYYRALQIAIDKMHQDGKPANVLDIGTGTGLLSIMAVKCGADSVVACEAFKPMSECCLKILEINGVADRIKVIPKRSTELTVGENCDLEEKANILVTEVFDTELIGEGALSTFSHAHKNLLEKECIVIPDSAVIYAQIIECPTLQKCNKLNDLADAELDVILKTPLKMKSCAGSAAVHDLQLSQLPRSSLKELSNPVPVFYYDWSGKTPIDMQRTVKQDVIVTDTGTAQMVFMWWELSMDTEGRIPLTCAPWWCHPEANLLSQYPQDTIPWRDHWMQAVYYLPNELAVSKNKEVTLISCQDEYSVWFYLEDETQKYKTYKRPICECGVHMAFSRTHVSYLNDGKRSKKFLSHLREVLTQNSIVLDLNGGSLMGLAAAKMGAKQVYILESMNLNIGILEEYIKENDINNVKILASPDDVLSEVTHVVCDPNFTSSLMPWENLKVAYLLHQYKDKLNSNVLIVPESCEIWTMPVQFHDLHKIRIPLGKCEGIDMTVFDELVENSREISDAELEAQPLWEYPCWSRGHPKRLIRVDMTQLASTYGHSDTLDFSDSEDEKVRTINGFAIWAEWSVGGRKVSSGPIDTPALGQRVQWDPHTRQAVKILKCTYDLKNDHKWYYQVACDLKKGDFSLNIELISH